MSKRPAALAIAIGLVLASVAGLLGVLHAMAPDREAIRATLTREIERVEALPANDPLRKDRHIEELLAVEDYQTHARALWLRLERLHGPAHQAARADEAARKVVPPFLARCAALDGKSTDELRSLDDEAHALQDEHGSSRFGPALAEARSRLAAALAAKTPGCTGLDHFRLQQDAQKDRLGGRYAQALARIDEHLLKHPPGDASVVWLREERENILRSAAQGGEKILVEARNAPKAEGVRILERALPNFKGLPEEGRLRALLTELRRP